MPFSADKLEVAMVGLVRLLDVESTPESQFQKWFETEPDVFRALGYSRAVPHPTLPRADVYDLVPDFLCQRTNGLWEVVELKLPTQKLVKSPDRRTQFYDPVEQYISQCREYAKYFRDSANRSLVNQRYGIDVQDEVPSLVIVGNGEQENRRLINSLLLDRGYRVELLPYNEVLKALELARTQFTPHAEGLAGFSVQLIIALESTPDHPNLIVDVAPAFDRDRMTVLVDESDRLDITLLGHDGRRHELSAPLENLGLEYGKYSLLGVQLGRGEDSAILTVEVDGVTRSRRVFDPVDARLDADSFTWGGGLPDAPATGSFRFCEGAVIASVLNLTDRLSLVTEMGLPAKRAMFDQGHHPSHIHIVPGTCIVSTKHPHLNEVSCGPPAFVPGPDHVGTPQTGGSAS